MIASESMRADGNVHVKLENLEHNHELSSRALMFSRNATALNGLDEREIYLMGKSNVKAAEIARCINEKLATMLHFGVLLEQDGKYLCSCVLFCQYELACRHTIKAMVSPLAHVHYVSTRWLIRSISQHSRDLQNQKEPEKEASTSVPSALPSNG